MKRILSRDPSPISSSHHAAQPLVPCGPDHLLTQTQGWSSQSVSSQFLTFFTRASNRTCVIVDARASWLFIFYPHPYWLWLMNNPEVIHGCDLLGFKGRSWASIWGQSRGLHVHVFRMKLKKPTKEADMLGFFCCWGKDWSFWLILL